MGLYTLLNEDLEAMGAPRKGFWGILSALFFRLDFCAVFLFRLSVACRKYGCFGRFLSFLLWRLNAFVNACDLRPQAEIGPGFSLPHPMGVVMGPIVAGKRLTVHQNVTIGRSRSSDEYGGVSTRAVLGDDVMIYAGAVLLGGIKVGNKASIGANAVVLSDVPEGHTAFAMPARCLPPKKTEPSPDQDSIKV